MNKDELRERIKEKWGTYTRFARQVGIKESKVKTALFRDIPSAVKLRRKLEKLALHTEPVTYLPGYDLNPMQSEAIRLAIAKNYRFAIDLHREHPEFSQAFLSNVINGKTVTQCGQVKALAQILNINLSDYEQKKRKQLTKLSVHSIDNPEGKEVELNKDGTYRLGWFKFYYRRGENAVTKAALQRHYR